MKHLIIILSCLAITLPAIAKNDKAGKKQKALPPGLEKKIERGGEIPPGWQRKIAKGEVLDSDLYDIAVRVPNKPTKNYPQTKDTELLKLEDRIIRIKNDTKEILEIFGVETGS